MNIHVVKPTAAHLVGRHAADEAASSGTPTSTCRIGSVDRPASADRALSAGAGFAHPRVTGCDRVTLADASDASCIATGTSPYDAEHCCKPIIYYIRQRRHEQFLISMVKSREEFDAPFSPSGPISCRASWTEVAKDDMVLSSAAFIHYHFVYSHACLFRCHLSEAFASARSAIDAALIGAFIIKDRSLQVQYLKREPPFNNLARHLGNMARDKKPMPHHLVPALRDIHGKLSRFASHADIDSFMHRVEIMEKDAKPHVLIQYFQFASNDVRRKLHFVQLARNFQRCLKRSVRNCLSPWKF